MPKKMDRESIVFCSRVGRRWLGVGLAALVLESAGLTVVGLAVVGLAIVGLAISLDCHRWVGCLDSPSLVGHRYNWSLGLLGLVVGFAWIGRWVCLDW